MNKEPKSHKALLEFIENDKKKKKITFSQSRSPLAGIKGSLIPDFKEFRVVFKGWRERGLAIGKYHKKVPFVREGKDLIAERVYLRSHTISSDMEGNIDQYYTKGFSKTSKHYFSLVIPLRREIRFHDAIEYSWVKTDLGYSSATRLVGNIHDEELEACVLYDSAKNYYLFLESHYKQDFESFNKKSFAVQLALGYLTGHLAGDKGYFFAFTAKDKKNYRHVLFSGFRDSIIGGYQPVCSNPFAYAYTPKLRAYAEKLYSGKILRTVTTDEFSLLAEKIHDDRNLVATLLLMLESSVASLMFMPGGFAIALETLADIILGPEESKALTKDKTTMKELRKKCHAVVEEYRPVFGDDIIKVLTNKINDFNKMPNASRLKEPFTLLGLKLLPEDERVLNTRNDFLHGRTPDIMELGTRTENRISRDIYYSGMRFFVLLNVLILKWVGFNGKIVNHVKHQEGFTKIKLPKEKLFRQI